MIPDEPHQRGDSHLLEANYLGNIANAVLSGRVGTGDYATKVLCLTDWRRKEAAYDLAPLAQHQPPVVGPDFKPLPRGVLERAFTLQPGGYRLTEVQYGLAAGWWRKQNRGWLQMGCSGAGLGRWKWK